MAAQLKESQTFRVFFSSPFKGMEEEREELTRRYLPEIQHKCTELGLQFVTVDMRWGISAESAQKAQTINICLREIDRSDMFVCFFGQRYGWQGHTDTLLQENINAALGKYPWLEEARDSSVTELELRHGFLNSPGDMPAVVCFRDKKYDDIMKERLKDKAANYSCEDNHCMEKMNDLKRRVAAEEAKALAVHMDYPNPHEGARLIYESVIKYLEENVLKQSEESSRREKDQAPHKAFAANRTSLYVENPHHHDFLNEALKNVKEGEECSHVLVTGPAGCGKSALLCNWLQNDVSQQPDVVAIPYYIGCAPSTRDPEEVLGFVYGELDHLLSDGSSAEEGSETARMSHRNSELDSVMKGSNVAQEEAQGTDDTAGVTADNTTGGDAQAGNHNDNRAEDTCETASAKASVDDGTGAGAIDQATGMSITGSEEKVSRESAGEGLDKGSERPGGISDKGDQTTSDKGEKDNKVGDQTTSDKGDKDNKVPDKNRTVDKDTSEESTNKSKAKEKSRPKGKELQHQVVQKLEKLVEKGHRVVLIFDAVNRLVAANKISQTLYWLPQKLSKGVLCVVSTDDMDQASIDVLFSRDYKRLKVEPLEIAAQREICVKTLKHSGKELSEAQLDRIVKVKQTENPLFLKIVLVELSIFGYFRKLDEKIDSLIFASNIKELLHNCLERLEQDYNMPEYEGNLVGEILKAIYISHQGLTESEIVSIFKIASNVWSPLFFAMEYFIVSHQGNLGFAFSEIREAVKEKYLPCAKEESRARQQLIAYFDQIRQQVRPWMPSKKLSEKWVEHAVVELVWMYRTQDDKEAVADVLTDLAVFRIMNQEYELDLLELWRWTGLKWSEVCCRLLKALDKGIVECYLATEEGQLDTDKSPGVRMRVATSHMRSFFDLANYLNGQEQVLQREIRILEHAAGKMNEDTRKEILRDAYYYLACTYASQDRYREARNLHESNMAEFERALTEKDDQELKKQIAYTHNGLGILCMNSGEFDKAIEHLSKSANFHSQNKDKKNEAASYTNLGLVYMYQQEFEKALEYSYKALEAYEEGLFGQLSMDLGNLYTNIGLIYRRMKRLNKAEEAYQKSLQIKANAVGWDHPVIATAFMNLGTLEMHRRNYAKSEEWTRKAISVYQANEFAVTKKEYRRCRENLFANMLKQDKYEEVLPFFIEVFDILNKNGWLDECLAGMHRKMVDYMLNNKPDMMEKAEEISMALIDSPKAHPQSYCHLLVIDLDLPEDKRKERPEHYSLDACMDKFPKHNMYPTVVELKMEHFLLPKEDKAGVRKLLEHVAANCTEENFEHIITKVTDVAKEQQKEEFWFERLKSLLDDSPVSQRVLQLFIRLCVYLDRPSEAVACIDTLLDSFKEGNASLIPDNVRPARTRLDVAKILIEKNNTALARQLLLLVTAKAAQQSQKDEARILLDSLPAEEEPGAEALVTSAA